MLISSLALAQIGPIAADAVISPDISTINLQLNTSVNSYTPDLTINEDYSLDRREAMRNNAKQPYVPRTLTTLERTELGLPPKYTRKEMERATDSIIAKLKRK